jgi:tetratricopeptide (TPR) repeat protein
VEGNPSPFGRYLVAAIHGRRREALTAFDALAPPPDAPAFRRGYHHNLRMDALGPFPGADVLWREVEAQFELTCPAIPCSAVALARAGALDRVHQLYQLFPYGPETSCYRMSRAIEAWRGQGPEAGLAILQGFAWEQDELYRGEMLLELGRNRDAIAALRRWRTRLGPDNDLAYYAAWAWPRSLLLEASALEREGDRDGARTLLTRVEKLWEHADADLPWLADARALRARLGAP